MKVPLRLIPLIATTVFLSGCTTVQNQPVAEIDSSGRQWQVVPVKQIELTVQVQDSNKRPLEGYDFAVVVHSAGNITGYQRIWKGGRTFELGARPEKVNFVLWGQAKNGARIPIFHEIPWPDLKKSYRLVFRFTPDGAIVDPMP